VQPASEKPDTIRRLAQRPTRKRQTRLFVPGGNLRCSSSVLAEGNLSFANTVSQRRAILQRSTMNTDQIKGNWNQLVGKAKEKWAA
jgi:hypothetical protein